MINNMGGNISGIGSNLLKINGVKDLGGCNHKIQPDIIEIGSWIGLAALTKSDITIEGVELKSLDQILNVPVHDCDVSSRGKTWNVKVNFDHVFPGNPYRWPPHP